MNEVRPASSAPPVVVKAASSKGVVDQNAETSGKKLPEVSNQAEVEKAKAVEKVTKPEEVEQAVSKINDYVQSIQRDLHFTVDEELDTTVVKVVDGDSGEVIRQIPEEVVLDLARKLNDDGELQLIDALG